ncbi:hypothetical protein NDU88_001879 [Pleurodeles waltl]|uniref:Uncharacterized protein n=1 Tax=Pleurodeles waltl TaxID=8319 RepID=A0AAV7W074_PLEWA|nr:hypothetical protein NDU88_001879 [Pleurodeles waltl]
MPAKLRPNPPRSIVGKSGSIRKRVYVLKARATYAKADWILPRPPFKPHLNGPLRRWSARETAGKERRSKSSQTNPFLEVMQAAGGKEGGQRNDRVLLHRGEEGVGLFHSQASRQEVSLSLANE